LFDLRIDVLNHFLEHNINLGASFMVRTRHARQIFAAHIAGLHGGQRHVFHCAPVLSRCLVVQFPFAVSAGMA